MRVSIGWPKRAVKKTSRIHTVFLRFERNTESLNSKFNVSEGTHLKMPCFRFLPEKFCQRDFLCDHLFFRYIGYIVYCMWETWMGKHPNWQMWYVKKGPKKERPKWENYIYLEFILNISWNVLWYDDVTFKVRRVAANVLSMPEKQNVNFHICTEYTIGSLSTFKMAIVRNKQFCFFGRYGQSFFLLLLTSVASRNAWPHGSVRH